MTIIRPGLAEDEIIYECGKCQCKFLFSVKEMFGFQIQGGYIKCPHCDEILFIHTNKHLTLNITKE